MCTAQKATVLLGVMVTLHNNVMSNQVYIHSKHTCVEYSFGCVSSSVLFEVGTEFTSTNLANGPY